MLEKLVEICILFDFYGNLLSRKQYKAVELYYIYDLSLSEIGEQMGISRQGVYDTLKRAEENLYKYESKLGLVHKFNDNKNKIKIIMKYTKLIKKKAYELNLNDIENHIEKMESILKDVLEGNRED